MNSYIVSFCDIESKESWIKRFEAQSYESCQNKVKNYLLNQYDWDDDIEFSDKYNEFVEDMKDNDIIIGNILDMELI